MRTIEHTVFGKTDVYEIVDEVPLGYIIWNVGPENAPQGYIPFCRPAHRQRFEGSRDIDPTTLKAVKADGAADIMVAVGHGQDTPTKMEQYIKRYSNSKTEYVRRRVEDSKKALAALKNVKGYENIKDWSELYGN